MNGTVKIILFKDLFVIFLLSENPTHVAILGFGSTLDKAGKMAVKQTVYGL